MKKKRNLEIKTKIETTIITNKGDCGIDEFNRVTTTSTSQLNKQKKIRFSSVAD